MKLKKCLFYKLELIRSWKCLPYMNRMAFSTRKEISLTSNLLLREQAIIICL